MLLAACGDDPPIGPPSSDSAVLPVLGYGPVLERFTGEVWVRGNVAYTTTWAARSAVGNAVKIWDLSGGADPVLVDSLIVPFASTLGDIQTSDDGALLVVATESSGGSIMIYDLADPIKPQLISRYNTPRTDPGVHTAEVQRVNGRLYAFLSVPRTPARLVIVDITDPGAPVETFTALMGGPFIHDVFVRDGVLFAALWNAGLSIWDIGGAGSGTVASPRLLSNTPIPQAHNVLWYHSPGGEKRYAFVGQEGPGSVGLSSSGDIHVVDVSDLSAPREVAFFPVPGAGAHNFSVDEARGILYAAFYNGGVRAIDITGDLSVCAAAEKSPDGRCDLAKMGREVAHGLLDQGTVYIWGVHLVGGRLYASDMLNGLWVLAEFQLP
jgi:hypothetical protein